jgi:hypothetical protein
MPASLFAGDYARVASKSMTDFPLPGEACRAFLAKDKIL